MASIGEREQVIGSEFSSQIFGLEHGLSGYGWYVPKANGIVNVGIGGAPVSNLTRLEIFGGGVAINDRGDSCCSQFIQKDNSKETHFYTYSSGDFQIHKYGTGSPAGAVFTILNNGNVGIGTASPNNPLQVAGTIKSAPTDQTGMFSLGAYVQSASQVGVYRGDAAVVTAGNFLNLGGYDGITFSASALTNSASRFA